MKTRDVIKAIEPFCDKIVYNGSHYKAYVKDTSKIVVISATPSDRNFNRQVYRDFRRIGIIVEELL